jgi:hypothetical protein
MPRDAIFLSDMRVAVLTVVCEPCGRRERYDVESLKRQHGGDVKMPDLLAALVADCPETRSFKCLTPVNGTIRETFEPWRCAREVKLRRSESDAFPVRRRRSSRVFRTPREAESTAHARALFQD